MDIDVHWYDQLTLFDRLNEKNLSWKVYFGDFPLSLVLVNQRSRQNLIRHRPMTEFFMDTAGDPVDFPAFSWIEPSYLNPGANDDHPPHDVMAGEQLIAHVYNALRKNSKLWSSTSLAVLFDEHGGFYDHQMPSENYPT